MKKKNHKFSFGDGLKSISVTTTATLEIAAREGEEKLLSLVKYYLQSSSDVAFEMATAAYASLVSFGRASEIGLSQGLTDLALDISTKGIQSIPKNSLMRSVGGNAAISGGIIIGVELFDVSLRFFCGEIKTWKEYGRLVCRAISSGVAASCCNVIGFASGATIGMAVGGPIGCFIGGLLGSITGSIIGGASVNYAFDKYWPSNEKKAMDEMILDALSKFYIKKKDLNNPNIFNEKTVREMYKKQAKVLHPDRGGTTEQFQELNICLGVLLGLLKKNGIGDYTHDEVIKAVLAIEYAKEK